MIKFLNKIKKINFYFFPPSHKKILIWDRHSVLSNNADLLFKKKNYFIFDTRRESINLFIVLKCLITFKLLNFKFSYIKILFNYVKPKIVYTSIDNNLDFFKLKKIYPKAIYISDQNAISKDAYASFSKKFIHDFFFRAERLSKKYNLYADVLFTFGNVFERKMKKIISGNYYCLGSSKNNEYNRNIGFYPKKNINSITFVCSGFYPATIKYEIKVFRYLIRYCKERKIKKIFFLGRLSKSKENFYRSQYYKGNWIYLPRKDNFSSYKYLSSSKMIVFTHGTLGFEALAKGVKTAAIYYKFPEISTSSFFKSRGPFWTCKTSYNEFSKIVDKVINYNQREWKNISKKYSSEILAFDKNNKKKKMIVNSILKYGKDSKFLKIKYL